MILLGHLVAPLPFEFRVESGRGLTVEMNGVPVIRGSWFQYYEPGWTKGYYSSSYNTQRVVQVDSNTVQVEYGSGGPVSGSQIYRRDGNRLAIHSEFRWSGDHPIKIEATSALLWAPALEDGTLVADGKATRALNRYAYQGSDLGARRFSSDASGYQFAAPLGGLSVAAKSPLTLFDGRGNFGQDWSEGKSLFWLGNMDLSVDRTHPAVTDVEFTFAPAAPAAAPLPRSLKLSGRRSSAALAPDTRMPVLIPLPKTDQLDWKRPISITGGFSFPIGKFDFLNELTDAMARRFVVPLPTGKAVPLDGGVSKLGLTPGGYRITVSAEKGISVVGEEDEGLRNGLARLAQMMFIRDGKLMLPTGTLLDSPQSTWRGVHLFVGPDARPFQTQLWQRVLRPLGFNHVVLQCERTAWKSLPGIGTPITMPREELVRLFAMYRSLGVDPIPLVQSFGHMEWLFANQRNLDLAVNPAVPYTIDPRKPGTTTLLSALWDEIDSTLHPTTMHFGCDEVDMRGFEPLDPELITQLWESQIPFLGSIATKHKATMMLWADNALAASEAPDAANAPSVEVAARRRAAIPKGALIGDWHYKPDPNPATFTKVLQLWKDAGMRPVASTWYRAENIRGFQKAAGLLGLPTLQTTWAGYESSEPAMLAHFNQFAAMILAADYGWSGRSELPKQLPYNPTEVFREMYFGRPSPMRPKAGTAFGSPGTLEIGRVTFGGTIDATLASILTAPSPTAGNEISIAMSATGSEIAVAASTIAPADDGTPVADLSISLAGGKTVTKRLIYGQHVRAADDGAPLSVGEREPTGTCMVRFSLGTAAKVIGVRLVPLNRYTGFRLRGLQLVD